MPTVAILRLPNTVAPMTIEQVVEFILENAMQKREWHTE
jgi:hypothetical protein